MALGNISISAVRFDNEPFVRSLTATIIPGTSPVFGTEPVTWQFSNIVWAKPRNSLQGYTSNTSGLYCVLSTMIFYVSSDTYDFRNAEYTLFEETISAAYLDDFSAVISSDAYTLIYDNFPNIKPPVLFSNFENTDFSRIFYRELASTYNFKLSSIANSSIINPTNFLLSSEYFDNWTTKTNLSTNPYVFPAPNGKNFATIFEPVSSSIFNTIASVTNITNGLSTLPKVPGFYTLDSTKYNTNIGNGTNAVFEVAVSLISAVTAVNIINGGQNYQVGDIISVDNIVFNPTSVTPVPPLTFEIGSLENLKYEVSQTVNLEPNTYACSFFAFPLSGRYIYLNNEEKGNVIFDVQNGVSYNNGRWLKPEVTLVDENLLSPKLPKFNTLGAGFKLGNNPGTVLTTFISSGRIYVGGQFSSYNNTPTNNVACLDAAGNIVSSFNPGGSGFNAPVRTITSTHDHYLIMGGDFTTYGTLNTVNSADRLISVNTNGAYNATFDTKNGFNNSVYTVAVSSNPTTSRLYVGGLFTRYKTGNNVFNRIVCLRGNTAAVETNFATAYPGYSNIPAHEWAVGFNGPINSIAINPTSQIIYAGGFFDRFEYYYTRQNIIALNEAGTPITTTFVPNNSAFNNIVQVLTLDTDSNILAGGLFTTYDRNRCNGLVRINPSGKADTTFANNLGLGLQTQNNTPAQIYDITVDPNTENIYVGGNFNRFNSIDENNGIICLFNSGQKNTDFNNAGNSRFSSVVSISLSGTSVFVGGDFSQYKGFDVNSFTVVDSEGNVPVISDNRFAGWRRCSAVLTLTGTTTQSVDIDLGVTSLTNNISSACTKNDSVLVWGGQIIYGETTTSLTPYISTLNHPVTKNYNDAWLSYSNFGTRYPIELSATTFTGLCSYRTAVPAVCTINVTVSAAGTYDSLKPWYTPHIVTNDLSAVFISKMLTADFIAFPSSYFDTYGRQVTGLNLGIGNYTTSPGVCFYGEGHTETIFLSAKNTPNINNYYWTIGDQTLGFYTPSAISINEGTFMLRVSSQLDFYPTIPITLQITDNKVLSSGPFYYYDDVSGELLPYPFIYSTVDSSGNRNPNNTRFRDSIQVVSYEFPASSFYAGVCADYIFLPGNDSVEIYNAFLRTALSGYKADTLDICYDKYNLVWKWSTFVGCSSNPNTFSGLPSSWSTMQCFYSAGSEPTTFGSPVSDNPGPFPKRWRLEGATFLSAERSPVFCYSNNMTWTLSTPNWIVNQSNPGDQTEYTYSLQYNNGGLLPYTFSTSNNTPLFIRGAQTITCAISSPPYDWQLKKTIVADTENTTVLSRGNFSFYLPNKYVLTGAPVIFENISRGFNNVEKIVIDFENATPLTLLPDNLYSNFTTTYSAVGPKTIIATTYYQSSASEIPTVDTFRHVLEVVPYFDSVSPDNYLTEKTQLNLPYPEKPYIAPNDWAVEDNINAVLKKFDTNLKYLQTRSDVYDYRPTEYYGWFGVAAPIEITPEERCRLWVWEDLNCLIEGGQLVTWEDLEKVDSLFPTITTTGPLASCGAWMQHECPFTLINPDCYGKHGIEWKWKSRKASSSSRLITWKNTKSDNAYAKRWRYEPWIDTTGELIVYTPCEPGIWNVNIPKIDVARDPINDCTFITRCQYQGIASRDNILYTALATEIRLLSSDRVGTYISSRQTIDDIYAFRNIKNLALDSNGKLFVLDGDLGKVASYNINIHDPIPFELVITWGGYGTSITKSGFYKPNDIHIDAQNDVYVTDTGNRCIKIYSNTGTWKQTITNPYFGVAAPLSVCVDSDNLVHILLEDGKIVVTNKIGEQVFEYTITKQTTQQPVKINTNYNREIIYVLTSTQVVKYFKNGTFFNYLFNNKECVTDITTIVQDEHRNTLVTSGDKIIKYVDLMTLRNIKGSLPETYWPLNNILIHKDEYIQSWVYDKAFQRLWDNIELFRQSLIYDNTNECRKATQPIHAKDKITIGQNEIVTSTVINRNIGYLWDNFLSLVKYFDPDCE